MKQKCERKSSIDSTSGGDFRYVKEGNINQYFFCLDDYGGLLGKLQR